MRIILDGVEIPPNQLQGEEGVTITITVEDEAGNSLVKTYSGELTAYGDAFDAIEAALIVPLDGSIREIPIELYDRCAEPNILVFKGVVRGDLLSWCADVCEVQFTAVEKTEDSAAYDCLKSTLIYDDHDGFQSRVHPRMRYCDEIRPEWLHYVVLTLGMFAMLVLDILTPLFIVIAAIITIINSIIDVLQALGSGIDNIDLDGDPETNTFEEFQNTRTRLVDSLVGCGRVHPSPLLREYLNNVCTKCGLTLQSSILLDPSGEYYNTVLWNAPVQKGTRDTGIKYIYENRPIMSGHSLLQKIGPVFNAGHRVVNGVLHFERKDKLPRTPTWVDPAAIKADGRMIGNICYNFTSENPAAYAVIGFSEDALDEPGNEARDFYKDVVEWNLPVNLAQKGEKQIQFQFGMVRNRRDGITRDVFDAFRFYPTFAGTINDNGHAMLVSRGLSAFPKLLIWNGGTGDSGEVQRGYDRPATFKPADECYNFPLWVTEYGTTPNTGYEPDAADLNLYGRFHAIENPKVINGRGYEFKFTFEYNATELASLDPLAGVPLTIGGVAYVGRITSIVINTTERTILVAGKV